MYLENLVIDALEPQRLGGFWEAALGSERVTDEPDVVETRLELHDWPILDLCFPAVPEPPTAPPRLLPVLAGGGRAPDEVERLVGLGARRRDEGAGDGVFLADPEGNPFLVTEDAAAYAGTGPLAAFLLDSGDPDRDSAFWAWLAGWSEVPARGRADGTRVLRHPSRQGPVLELRPEAAAKGATKNRLHLDVRLERGEDADVVAASIADRGGRPMPGGPVDLPWRSYVDPSGNELCVLPASS